MIRGDPIFKILEIPVLRIADTFNRRAAETLLPESADSTTIAVAVAVAAATATSDAVVRRRWWRPNRCAARRDVLPIAGSLPFTSAGAWTASWIAADRSPQKSAALGGGSGMRADAVVGCAGPGSASGVEACRPNGTSSSRGPSQSRGSRTTLLAG
jgi:hypothetical protein